MNTPNTPKPSKMPGVRAMRRTEPVVTWTIKAWCRRRSVSQATWYRMTASERPELIYVHGMPRITAASDAAWEKKLVAEARARHAAAE